METLKQAVGSLSVAGRRSRAGARPGSTWITVVEPPPHARRRPADLAL